ALGELVAGGVRRLPLGQVAQPDLQQVVFYRLTDEPGVRLDAVLACRRRGGSRLGGRLGLGVRRGEWCRGEQQPAGGDHREVSYWHVLHSSAQSYICARSDTYVEGLDRKSTRLNSSHG